MDEINLGERIVLFREKNKMSQKELAQRIQITPSMLSQIERNNANPSLSTLKLISKELQVPLYYLFMTEGAEKDIVVRKNERKQIGSRDKRKPYLELLTPDASGNIEFFEMRLQPHTENSHQLMNHEGEEVALVLKGSIVLQMENVEYVLHEGDSVRIPGLAYHRWYNNSDEDTRLVFAVTPPNF